MVKSLEPQTNKSSPRLKLPINLIIFWYKRLSNIINSKNFEATNNTGKIATLKLKVKENAAISETTIKLTNI